MKATIILINVLWYAQVAWSQQYHGKVLCKATKEPIGHVEVWLEGSKDRVYTDTDGSFKVATNNLESKALCFHHDEYMYDEVSTTNIENTMVVTLRKKQKSTASKRWEQYVSSEAACSTYPPIDIPNNPKWNVSYEEKLLKGDLAPDPKMVRRDPSAILRIESRYYMWYTRSEATPSTWFRDTVNYERVFPWDMSDIWYATSEDGWIWKEQGPAVERGEAGSYDSRSAFTPEVFAHNGKYYIVYQALQGDYVPRVKNTVAMAVADSPDGPFVKLAEPILFPSNNGIWEAGTNDHHAAIRKGDFDSHKVHDPCLTYYKGKFYLYYKGERMGEEHICGQREIKWGVAIADKPEGPYIKSEYNPITNTGHEVIVWQYNGGVGILQKLDGPERGTIQYATDGVNFEIMGHAQNIPEAYGIYRSEEADASPTAGIQWGMGHAYHWEAVDGGTNYILRYDLLEDDNAGGLAVTDN